MATRESKPKAGSRRSDPRRVVSTPGRVTFTDLTKPQHKPPRPVQRKPPQPIRKVGLRDLVNRRTARGDNGD